MKGGEKKKKFHETKAGFSSLQNFLEEGKQGGKKREKKTGIRTGRRRKGKRGRKKGRNKEGNGRPPSTISLNPRTNGKSKKKLSL